MSKIFIFDIDGCILESVFPNLMPSNQHPDAQEQVVKEVNEKGWDVKLYPEFLRFYYNNCTYRDLISIVTGRQEHRFNKLTYHQLQELRYDELIFYPKEGIYQKDIYLSWKCSMIQKLLKKGFKILIFDDHDDYFDDIDPHGKYDISYFEVHTNEGWRMLNGG